DQRDWIRQGLDKLTDREAIKRAQELSEAGHDVPEYLYISCRCAIAHAGTDPTVDPEDFDDEMRLRADLPLIKNLVEILIETEFGVKSSRTVWKEHLYELNGFKEIIGPELTSLLITGGTEPPNKIQVPEHISIRLWDKKPYPPFEQMTVQTIRAAAGIVHWECTSMDRRVSFLLELNFPKERLGIDPFDGVSFRDDGSPEAAIDAAEIQRFRIEYLANGSLEVWEPVENRCLGRCDPFIPENINLRATIENLRRAEEDLQKEAERRRKILASLNKADPPT
ncbi:unnamed protein product, partial [marine sediment metagenome]